MLTLYTDNSNDPKYNAQSALKYRTHYVDDDTLRFHKSRVLSARASHDGLLFWIVESHAVDYLNTRREYRGVVFDLSGQVIHTSKLGEGFRTSDAARKDVHAFLATVDAKASARAAIAHLREWHKRDIDYLEAQLAERG